MSFHDIASIILPKNSCSKDIFKQSLLECMHCESSLIVNSASVEL